MILDILVLIAGLFLVLFGADGLVNGASFLARRFHVSEFVIGLTIVAMGTSAPEMVVSFISAIEGKSDLAVGNIVGSNIFNTCIILGLSALIYPMMITKENVRRDIPVNLFVTVLLILLGMSQRILSIGSNSLEWFDGIVLLLIFFSYLWVSFVNDPHQENEPGKQKPLWRTLLLVIGGLGMLIFGGHLFVDSAQRVARELGLSDKFIAITILAAGTSLPELATSLVAAAKGKGQLALGNVLGSNTFNILLILGGSCLIHPLSMDNMSFLDIGLLLFTALALLVCARLFVKNQVDRIEGILLFLLGAGYMSLLCLKEL